MNMQIIKLTPRNNHSISMVPRERDYMHDINPLYSDEISHSNKSHKNGIVHYIC